LRSGLVAETERIQVHDCCIDQLLCCFVGRVMKAMKGKANPKVVNELVTKKLG